MRERRHPGSFSPFAVVSGYRFCRDEFDRLHKVPGNSLGIIVHDPLKRRAKDGNRFRRYSRSRCSTAEIVKPPKGLITCRSHVGNGQRIPAIVCLSFYFPSVFLSLPSDLSACMYSIPSCIRFQAFYVIFNNDRVLVIETNMGNATTDLYTRYVCTFNVIACVLCSLIMTQSN